MTVKPLGVDRFATATGINEADWAGRHWARWSDAIREAGLAPNTLQPKTTDDVLLTQLARFIREIKRYPTVREMRMRKRQDDAFPNHKVIERRWSKQALLEELSAFCERTDGWSDVAAICRTLLNSMPDAAESESDGGGIQTGYVYLALMRVGREKRYKIGKTKTFQSPYGSMKASGLVFT